MNIRIISPAGHIDPEVAMKGVATLRSWGHEVSVASNALTEYGRYAGTPEERAADLVEALQDPSVDIIWCARGGYGCMHILDRVPQALIARSRKWMVGYSDVTALHALWQRAGVPSLHAPMMKHLGEEPEHYTSVALRAWLESMPTGEDRMESRPASLSLPSHPWNVTGVATGRLVGGNLAVLSALHGTPYDFDYDGALLFVEDIGESPYKIDRMLQTLRLGGVMDRISGLIVGQFTECHDDPQMPVSREETIVRMVDGRCPVCFDAPVGHVTDNYPLVEGAVYSLNVGTDGVDLL